MKVFLERSKIRFRNLERKMVKYFFGPPERMVEYSFVMRNLPCSIPRSDMRILEVGAGESSLSHDLFRMGSKVWVVDVNPYPFHHRNLKLICEDITKINLPNNYFDYALSVSTIEHVGMGWYGDSIKRDGDLLAMKNISNAIKERGLFCVTVPVAPTYREISGRDRIYDLESLNKLIRLSNLQIGVLEFYMPTRKVGSYAFGWINATITDIIEGRYLRIYSHAVACCCLQHASKKKGLE